MIFHDAPSMETKTPKDGGGGGGGVGLGWGGQMGCGDSMLGRRVKYQEN